MRKTYAYAGHYECQFRRTYVKGVKMTEKEKFYKYIKMTEAEVKELTASAYKEGLARGQPIEDTSGTIEDAKEIQKKTFAELLGLSGIDNEGSKH
jgi:hypothetical protein